jgi:hypothetical protein
MIPAFALQPAAYVAGLPDMQESLLNNAFNAA